MPAGPQREDSGCLGDGAVGGEGQRDAGPRTGLTGPRLERNGDSEHREIGHGSPANIASGPGRRGGGLPPCLGAAASRAPLEPLRMNDRVVARQRSRAGKTPYSLRREEGEPEAGVLGEGGSLTRPQLLRPTLKTGAFDPGLEKRLCSGDYPLPSTPRSRKP